MSAAVHATRCATEPVARLQDVDSSSQRFLSVIYQTRSASASANSSQNPVERAVA